MDDSRITCNEVINSYDKEIKTITTNFNKEKVICNIQIFYGAVV